MAAPAVVVAVNRATRPLVGRSVSGLLAAHSLTASLGRTSVVVAALATAIAMMASVGIMVGNFRRTVAVWLDTQLQADLYVKASQAFRRERLPRAGRRAPPHRRRAVPRVAAVDVFHAVSFRYQDQRATLGCGDLDVVRRFGRLRFLPGQDRDAILRRLPDQDRAIVGEPFPISTACTPAIASRSPIGARHVPLTIAGVYYDYSRATRLCDPGSQDAAQILPWSACDQIAVYLNSDAKARTGAAAKSHLRTPDRHGVSWSPQ